MRLLALVTDAYGGYGGIAQYSRDFLESAISASFVDEVVVLPRTLHSQHFVTPPKLRQLPPHRSRLSYSIEALRQCVRARPDVIYCGHLYHGPLALLLARLFNARLIIQLHGDEIWKPVSKLYRTPLEQCDRLIAVSHDTRDRALAVASPQHDSFSVISCTVGPQFVPGDRQSARDKFKIDSREKVVLSVARLDGREDARGYKGHDLVMDLVARQNQDGEKIRYLIAGDGDDRERLVQLADRLGISNLVDFLGIVPAEDLPDLYRAADLFALPSTGEGFGIVFVESMACGTPAIGLNVGGSPDALCHGELGHCSSLEGFPALFTASLISSGTRDPDLARRTRERFGFAVFRRRVLDILQPLIRN
ncbi:glycosyltransferase [Aurantiacibacter luteus]|uniref:glycosyltransferase n=1 Tax=Aurantiacibacter luteus TaxID=1581420 RepID=UPI000A777F5C|nr:glycosyltransferase [Aurantiacibacter luteus]